MPPGLNFFDRWMWATGVMVVVFVVYEAFTGAIKQTETVHDTESQVRELRHDILLLMQRQQESNEHFARELDKRPVVVSEQA